MGPIPGNAAGTRQRIIRRNRYEPTEEQKAIAYRPTMSRKGYQETLKVPGDLVITDRTTYVVR